MRQLPVQISYVAAFMLFIASMKTDTLIKVQSYGRTIRSIQMSGIRDTIMGPVGPLLGLAVAVAMLAVIAGLGVLATGTSAGLTSAITQINSFLALVGLGVAVAVVIKVLSNIG